MAVEPHSARVGAWNTLFNECLNLTLQLEQTPPHTREPLERARADAQDDLLDTSAPTLVAVLRKLEIIFEGELHGLDQASEERRLVIADLEGLIQAQRQILGA